jgi:hypothetical protein
VAIDERAPAGSRSDTAASKRPERDPPPPLKTIVCFGDSNTWGYIEEAGHIAVAATVERCIRKMLASDRPQPRGRARSRA